MDRYNSILWRTHDRKNVLLLHLRNHHFDIARHWHEVQNICAVLPIILIVIMYATYYYLDIREIDVADLRSVSVGVTMMFTGLVALISLKINKEKGLSDRYRELYDCNVFGLNKDIFMVDLSDVDVDRDELERRCFDRGLGRPSSQFSAWYNEVFSDSRAANIIGCEVQNISFSRDLYFYVERLYTKIFAVSIVIILIVCTIFAFAEGIFSVIPIIGAVAPKMYLLYKTIRKSHDIWTSHQKVMDDLVNNKDTFINATDPELRMMQNHMFRARADDIFIPRRIYHNHVKTMHDHSKFWYEFDRLYNEGLDMRSPSKAEDIMVVSRDYDSDSDGGYVMLSDIQARTREMMSSVHRIFTEAEPPIRYFTDGGTLIDIERPEHPVFWDDDIDICIHYDDLERAKSLLKEKLPQDCVIQDENDPYFIPYACKFRVRDRHSIVDEMDNSIHRYFGQGLRGVFIDVYGMIPPLSDSHKEKRYRDRMRRSYERMTKLEAEIYRDTPPSSYGSDVPLERRKSLEKNLSLYLKEKDSYLRMEREYDSITDRDASRMGYMISYTCDGPGLPYYRKEDVVPERYHIVEWNGITLNIPDNPEAILEAFYGKDWNQPTDGYRTVLKHISTYDEVGSR